jgi:hypothetical protein
VGKNERRVVPAQLSVLLAVAEADLEKPRRIVGIWEPTSRAEHLMYHGVIQNTREEKEGENQKSG